jgi:hypothetical protein
MPDDAASSIVVLRLADMAALLGAIDVSCVGLAVMPERMAMLRRLGDDKGLEIAIDRTVIIARSIGNIAPVLTSAILDAFLMSPDTCAHRESLKDRIKELRGLADETKAGNGLVDGLKPFVPGGVIREIQENWDILVRELSLAADAAADMQTRF